MSIQPKDSRPVKVLITGILISWLFCIFLPGSYSSDSWSQFSQTVSGNYDDWFGASMSFTWRMLWLLTGNYAVLFVVQMALYGIFVFLLLQSMRTRSVLFWVLLALATFFSFIPQYVMRDSLMALLWGIAVLLLLQTQKSPPAPLKPQTPSPLPYRLQSTEVAEYNAKRRRRLLKITAVFLLAYGLWVRTNTVVAMLPLLWMLMSPFKHPQPSSHGQPSPAPLRGPRFRWKPLFLSAATCLLLLFMAQFLTYRVLHAAKAHPTFKLKLLDIAGISKLSGQNYFPAGITQYPYFHEDSLLQQYTPASFDEIVWPPDGRPSMIPYPVPALDSAVTKSWLTAIKQHPLLYLQNRFSGFLYYLRIRQRFKPDGYWNVSIWIEPANASHVQQVPNAMRDRFTEMYTSLNKTCIYSPWFWLLLNSAAFVLFLYYSKHPYGKHVVRPLPDESGGPHDIQTNLSYYAEAWRMQAWIQLSGILYTLSQLPVYQHDRDFRYNYWNVFVFLIALATPLRPSPPRSG